MDKKFIKISTVKRRIDNILSAYDEQLCNFNTHETSASSGGRSSSSSSSSAENEQLPFLHNAVHIESILKVTEKRTPSQVKTPTSHNTRRTGAMKRPPTSKPEIPNKKIQIEMASPLQTLRTSTNSKIRSTPRQRNLREVVEQTTIPLDSNSDLDKNHGEKCDELVKMT